MRGVALVVALASLAACGEPTMLAVELRTDALFYDPTNIEIFVYGSGATCSTLLANAASPTRDRCASSDVESGTCYIETLSTIYAPMAVSDPIQVPVGDRQVLVLGYEDTFGLVGQGCVGVTVREGETARASILMQDPP